MASPLGGGENEDREQDPPDRGRFRTVRYPAEHIKDAILHPDPEIRHRATSYFAKANSDDSSIMAQVIRAVRTYGRQDAYRLIGLARDLGQTDESIAWIIGELNDQSSDRFENYPFNLSMVLVEADPALLLPREAAILEARHLQPDLRPVLTERLGMLSWDEETCWRELETFCAEAVGQGSSGEVELGRRRRIVGALARHWREGERKLLDLLGQEVAEDDRSPMLWLEPLVVRLAGLIRLEAGVPPIVAKLIADGGDILNEECPRR